MLEIEINKTEKKMLGTWNNSSKIFGERNRVDIPGRWSTIWECDSWDVEEIQQPHTNDPEVQFKSHQSHHSSGGVEIQLIIGDLTKQVQSMKWRSENYPRKNMVGLQMPLQEGKLKQRSKMADSSMFEINILVVS